MWERPLEDWAGTKSEDLLGFAKKLTLYAVEKRDFSLRNYKNHSVRKTILVVTYAGGGCEDTGGGGPSEHLSQQHHETQSSLKPRRGHEGKIKSRLFKRKKGQKVGTR